MKTIFTAILIGFLATAKADDSILQFRLVDDSLQSRESEFGVQGKDEKLHLRPEVLLSEKHLLDIQVVKRGDSTVSPNSSGALEEGGVSTPIIKLILTEEGCSLFKDVTSKNIKKDWRL